MTYICSKAVQTILAIHLCMIPFICCIMGFLVLTLQWLSVAMVAAKKVGEAVGVRSSNRGSISTSTTASTHPAPRTLTRCEVR